MFTVNTFKDDAVTDYIFVLVNTKDMLKNPGKSNSIGKKKKGMQSCIMRLYVIHLSRQGL